MSLKWFKEILFGFTPGFRLPENLHWLFKCCCFLIYIFYWYCLYLLQEDKLRFNLAQMTVWNSPKAVCDAISILKWNLLNSSQTVGFCLWRGQSFCSERKITGSQAPCGLLLSNLLQVWLVDSWLPLPATARLLQSSRNSSHCALKHSKNCYTHKGTVSLCCVDVCNDILSLYVVCV